MENAAMTRTGYKPADVGDALHHYTCYQNQIFPLSLHTCGAPPFSIAGYSRGRKGEYINILYLVCGAADGIIFHCFYKTSTDFVMAVRPFSSFSKRWPRHGMALLSLPSFFESPSSNYPWSALHKNCEQDWLWPVNRIGLSTLWKTMIGTTTSNEALSWFY